MPITSRLFAYFDPETLEVTSTGTLSMEARDEVAVELPLYTIDLTDDPTLFDAVREDPGRYRVENGRVVLKNEE